MKKYKVHSFDLSMTNDQHKLEDFLNSLNGEVVAVLPNITPFPIVTRVQTTKIQQTLSNRSIEGDVTQGSSK